MNPVLYALIKQHSRMLLAHFSLTISTMVARLLGPLGIRWFLIWLREYKDGKAEASEGWLWGLLILVSPAGMALLNNQVFW